MLAQPTLASAHPGAPIAPHDLATAWNLSPLLLGGLAALGWLYACGVANVWRTLGRGKVTPVWRVWAFALGLLTLVIALVSPLDALAGALFSAHMAQHLLLALVAAPLLVAGAPLTPLLWSLPAEWRPRVTRWSRSPLVRPWRRALADPWLVLLLHAGILWLWHLPALYELALRNEAVHLLEHVTLLGSAALFWWVVLAPVGRRHVSHGASVLLTFAATLQGTLLGALLAFSDVAWYPAYAGSTPVWGIGLLDDQRLAGSLMVMPGGIVYFAAALFLLTRLLGAPRMAAAPAGRPGSW